jgi:hypothetical protein
MSSISRAVAVTRKKERELTHSRELESLVDSLRAHLPLSAIARPPLMRSLRRAPTRGSVTPRCMVTGVFDAGRERGILCHIAFDDAPDTSLIVAPIEQLSFGGGKTIVNEIVKHPERGFNSRRAREARGATDRRPAGVESMGTGQERPA